MSIRTRSLIDRYAPPNRLLRRLITREPARWPGFAICWGAAFLIAAIVIAVLVYLGLPEIWYLPFFLFLYDGGKFIAYALQGFALAAGNAAPRGGQ
ncbi:hypothetical protein [Brevibacterium luteolum]|uniref:hypothetical protein n=1 Tax=Brevibacterium luteolum TaxID=199591 RepID=UPI00223AA892|nr:hypothetical protein [Brevibacterium luteolum]MCT1829915.1 hypothetical protein [Brevibacterium luteolum]